MKTVLFLSNILFNIYSVSGSCYTICHQTLEISKKNYFNIKKLDEELNILNDKIQLLLGTISPSPPAPLFPPASPPFIPSPNLPPNSPPNYPVYNNNFYVNTDLFSNLLFIIIITICILAIICFEQDNKKKKYNLF